MTTFLRWGSILVTEAAQWATGYAADSPEGVSMKQDTIVNQIVKSVESFNGWSKLKQDEQKTVKAESTSVLNNLDLIGKSDAAIGQSLRKIRDILEPYRMFVGFIDHAFHMSRATAYRYIAQAQVITEKLPPRTAELAFVRGTRITPEMVEKNPPPENDNLDEALAYLEKLETHPVRTPVTDSETLLKESLNFIALRRNRVQGDEKAKQKWDREFIGMYLSKFGYTSAVSFNPVKVPAGFTPQRGRPVTKVPQAA